MYEVKIEFANQETVTCRRETLGSARYWANKIAREGSLFYKNAVTLYQIKYFEEKKQTEQKAESGIESIYAPMQTLGIEDCKMYVLRMVVEEVINCDCNACDELKELYCTALDCRKKDKAFNAEILKAFEYYIANEQEFLRLIDEEVKAVRERLNKQRID